MVAIRRRADFRDELLRRTKAALIATLEQSIAPLRLAGQTDLPGQDAVYAAKLAEAEKFVAKGYPVLKPGGKFPFLFAEAQATGQTGPDLATAIIAASELQASRLAELEGLRIGFKRRIKAALNEADAAQLVADFQAALSDFVTQQEGA